ncbi:riboflavin synthase beta chain [Nitrospira sp. KM1]|nr:6,7-dimethyl-8-ribityllumazine synthase [Nitrospira sp. KM1]BCA56824.1 riboflavin synthase beta chain [Nitrospira sp. KM1]
MKLHKGSHNATGLSIGIVVARFNKFVTSKLLSSCIDELTKHGIAPSDIEVVRVPGAFELPLVARTLAETKRFDAVICLGAVIRGDTPHFDYISAEASRGIGQAALDAGVPIIFGVLTTDTVAQAIERADPAKFNRGGEAAKGAIEMSTVMRSIRASRGEGAAARAAAKNGGTGRTARRRRA